MSDEINEIPEEHSDYKPADARDENVKHQLTGMYQNWFLDYASYVILERAVPHINDGDRKSTRLNSSHKHRSRMPSSA